MSRLLAIYPALWRARYGEEFLALLADRPPSFRERLDIIRGALDARLDPQLPSGRVADRAGLGAIAGFVCFYLALLVAANGPEHVDEYGTYRDGAAALPLSLTAMLFLLVALYRTIARLPLAQERTQQIGFVGLGSGLLWSIAPWSIPLLLTFLLAVAVVAIGAYRAGLWPAWLPAAVCVCVAVPLGVAVVQLMLPWYALRQAGFNYLIVFLPISGLWIAYGIGLLRGFPRVAEPAT